MVTTMMIITDDGGHHHNDDAQNKTCNINNSKCSHIHTVFHIHIDTTHSSINNSR